MTNRTDEYWALVSELSRPPQALSGSVDRARKRARRARFTHRLAAPAASLAAVAAAFVMLVNLSPTFALACSGVPIIRELTAAVALSPSLSAAVAHDYVQYIGQSQTVDGVTVNLEYAIVDSVQAVFFYSVDGADVRFWTSPRLTTPDGEGIGGYGTSSGNLDNFPGSEKLNSMTLSFTAGKAALPDRFTMEMYFQPRPAADQASEPLAPADTLAGAEEPEFTDPRDDPGTLCFSFDITLDPSRISEGRTVEVGKWLELDGQRIEINRLELFPTRTVVYLREDGANTAWLRSLKFFFTDGRGHIYDDIDGTLSAHGAMDSKSYLAYYFQSFYYDQPEELTLNVTKADWLDKDADRVFLDLTTLEASNLPDGVRVDWVTRSGQTVEIKVLTPPEYRELSQTFGGSYWDPEGGEHFFNQWGGGSEYNDQGEEIGAYEQLWLWDYPWNTVELELSRTGVSVYEQPVRVPLFP